VPALVLADPIHLRYLANFHVDPFSLGADYGGLLVLRPDGHATLYHDRRLPESVQAAHVDRREVVPWYDGQTPGRGPRRLAVRAAVEAHGGRIHDALGDPAAPAVDVDQPVRAGVVGADVVDDAHPLDDVAGGAADVDRLSAGTGRGSALDDRAGDSVSAQPVRQGEAGDAGAGDEYVHAYNVQRLAYAVQRTSAAQESGWEVC
jgi:hypothetical protein